MSNQRKTDLCDATSNGDYNRMQSILNEVVNIRDSNDHGRTPLHKACYRSEKDSHLQVVQLLLAHGADANIRDSHGATPLRHAIRKDNIEIVKLLIENNAEFDRVENDTISSLRRACLYACKWGSPDVLNFFLQKEDEGIDVNSIFYDRTLLYYAVHYACKCAVERGSYLRIVALLFDHGADVNGRNNMKDNVTPLHIACRSGHVDVVQLLLQNNADVEVKNDRGQTPLFCACFTGHVDVVHLLLKNNADVESNDNRGVPPLGYACYCGHVDVANLLL